MDPRDQNYDCVVMRSVQSEQSEAGWETGKCFMHVYVICEKPSGGQGHCDSSWIYFSGDDTCLYLIPGDSLNPKDAFFACKDLGGQKLTIKSKEKQQFIIGGFPLSKAFKALVTMLSLRFQIHPS